MHVYPQAIELFPQDPVAIREVDADIVLIDFGRVAFGNLQLLPLLTESHEVRVVFAENLKDGRADRNPPGAVRYAEVIATWRDRDVTVVAPQADDFNTRPQAIHTPPEWGVIIPFRWVEIEGIDPKLIHGGVQRRAAFQASWDDQASAFECSDAKLTQIWELCRYSIKATTFAGVYVDGDRERIPYEADAYLNQLSHYACDNDIEIARRTFDHLASHPTWPTEWAAHMIFMAYADWMHTGDRDWLSERFDFLKSKILNHRESNNGLVVSLADDIAKDIVDWPIGERDSFCFTSFNAVVNAFHLRSLELMSRMSDALGNSLLALDYSNQHNRGKVSFDRDFLDPDRGIYCDGKSTRHASIHANLFPLAFGLVADENRNSVIEYVKQKRMACSVYAAQYLLDGLLAQGEMTYALALMSAPGNRSWQHMLDQGATITWEAWDQVYKPNQDWNHAWGAAPANLLPRHILGIGPASPGWSAIDIRPFMSKLEWAKGRIPTPRGAIDIAWTAQGKRLEFLVNVTKSIEANIYLPLGFHPLIQFDGMDFETKLQGCLRVLTVRLDSRHRIVAKNNDFSFPE